MGNSPNSYLFNQIQPLSQQQAFLFCNDINCILQPKKGKGGIFLGNIKAASNIKLLKYYGIKSVLTVAIQANLHYNGNIPYHMIINAYDDVNYDLCNYMDQSMKFMKTSLKQTNILVHCMMGVSRSASFVIWYLMTYKKMSLSEAYNLVKQKRPIINPNKGFIRQLQSLESTLRSKNAASKQLTEAEIKNLMQNFNQGSNLRYSGVQI